MTAADRTATEELLVGTLLGQQVSSRPPGLTAEDCTGPRRAALEAMLRSWETGTAPDVGQVALAAGLPLSTLMAWTIEATDAATTAEPLISLLHRERLRTAIRPAAEALQRLAEHGEPGRLEATVATLARTGALDVLGELTGAPPTWTQQVTTLLNGHATPGVGALSVHQFLELAVPPRAYLLEPILRAKETAMLHAWRGCGKTHVALGIAWAVATGTSFLQWQAPRPRRVVYLDGEMPARVMQERLAALVAGSTVEAVDPALLQFVCADLFPHALPNLSTPEGQAWFAPYVEGAELVIVDSIATLASQGDQNAAESWLPLQAWALGLRRRGITVLFLHHDGKGLEQRGTSAREDILDVILQLRRPDGYTPDQGARFEVHTRKNRSYVGPGAAPFEATLQVLEGRATWLLRTLEDVQLTRAVALLRDGVKIADVAQELGVSRATAFRLQARAKDDGLL